MSRHRYPVEACRTFERTTLSRLQEALLSLDKSINHDADESIDNGSMIPDDKHQEKTKKVPNSDNKASKSTLKTVLGSTLGYGPALSEHMILDAGLSPNMKINEIIRKIDDDAMASLARAVSRFEDWLADVISGQKIPRGYILMQNTMRGTKESTVSQGIAGKVYPLWSILNGFCYRKN